MTTARIPSPGEVRDYILRRLPEDERARFEEAYFADDSLLERIEQEENCLVSEFVLGRLEETDRKRFEEALLGAPYYRQRIETTGALQRDLADRIPTRPSLRSQERVVTPIALRAPPGRRVTIFPGRTGTGVAFSLMTVLLVAAVLAAWTLRRDVVRLRRERVASASQGSVPAGPGAFLLLDESGHEGPPVRLRPAVAGPLTLIVPAWHLPDPPAPVLLTIEDEEGRTIWESAPLERSEATAGGVAVTVSPTVLPAGARRVVVLLAAGSGGPSRPLAILLADERTR